MGIALGAIGLAGCAACMFGMAVAAPVVGRIRRGPRGDGS
jgi:hypothetical protein